jgi:hypothetical protein
VVRLGEHDLSVTNEAESLDVGIEQIFLHPDYKPPQLYNDIALLK